MLHFTVGTTESFVVLFEKETKLQQRAKKIKYIFFFKLESCQN